MSEYNLILFKKKNIFKLYFYIHFGTKKDLSSTFKLDNTNNIYFNLYLYFVFDIIKA
jgi:hypothetical protein